MGSRIALCKLTEEDTQNMKSTTQFLATLGSNARRIRFPATGSRLRRLALTVAVVAAMALAIGGIAVNRAAFADDRHDDRHWVGTWSASPAAPDLGIPGLSNNGFNNQTLRLIVHTSIGGDEIGRASCRERVKMQGRAEALKEHHDS